jgi:chromosome segregation ATPase
MVSSFPRWLAAAACVGIAVAGDPALAQVARSGGNANAQALQQLQQLASERTALQAENDKLKAELAEVTKERDTLKTGQQTNDRRAKETSAALAHSNTQREAVDQELTQTKAKMQELIAKFRETVQKMRESEAEGTRAKQALAGRERELSTCVDHNQALYRLNDEILTRWEHQGLFTRISETESFTKIKRIQQENLMDDYRARAQDQLVAPVSHPQEALPAPPPAPTQAPSPPAAGGSR